MEGPAEKIEESVLWKKSPDALLLVDSYGTIRKLNDTAEVVFQYARSELIDKNVEVLIPARFHNHHQLRQAYYNNPVTRPMTGRSFFAQRKDGTELEVDIEITTVEGDPAIPDGVIVWLRDVTGQHQYLKDQSRVEAEAAGKARSRFLANISHEFRTPLNAILGLQQLILQKGDLEDSDKKNLDLAHQSSMQLLDLLNNVLEIAKIESEDIVLEERRFNLEPLRQSIDTMFRSQADRHAIEYSVRITSELPEFIVGDEGKIRQILIHLIGNAFKFTSNGEIRITFSRGDEQNIFIEVADTGSGISPDRMATLFEPFQQLKRENTKGEGSGLGLAICKNYVNAMGGSIHVDSEENKGACFRLTLPVLVEAEEKAPEPQRDVIEPSAPPEVEKIRVLVVDDSDSNRNVLGQLLTGSGYDFYEACDGIEAIEMADKCRPQIVLMDLQMPRMDGYDATREIKARMETIIVAVSANVFEADIKKAEEAGVSGFIKKPFRLGMILDEIEKQMGSGMQTPDVEESPALSLGNLSAGEVTDLNQALLRADPEAFKALIGESESLDLQTTSELLNLVNSYQYEKLLTLLSAR